MKATFKWTLLAAILTTALSCSKNTSDSATTATPEQSAAAWENVKLFSITYPNCTLAHGHQCTPSGGTCMLRFPPQMVSGGPEVPVRFYTPVNTGQGETGVQMMVEFLGTAPGIENGLLGPDEWDEPTIALHAGLLTAFGYNSIRVVNKRYYPVMDDRRKPYGYVIYDCIAE